MGFLDTAWDVSKTIAGIFVPGGDDNWLRLPTRDEVALGVGIVGATLFSTAAIIETGKQRGPEIFDRVSQEVMEWI